MSGKRDSSEFCSLTLVFLFISCTAFLDVVFHCVKFSSMRGVFYVAYLAMKKSYETDKILFRT